MKTSSIHHSCFRVQTISMALGSLILLPLGMPVATAAEEDTKVPAQVIEKSKNLQDKMSRMFHDTWKEIRDSVDAKRSKVSVATASVDMREQNDGYTVRISLPGRTIEKVTVNLIDGKTLRIMAPAEEKAGRYEQSIVLEGLVTNAKPQIERMPKEHLIVVRIPKAQGITETAPEAAAKPPPLPAPSDKWDRGILERMELMRREMDAMFQETFENFKDLPGTKEFFDRSRFGSSVELQDADGKYVVRAYLPDRNADNAKVTIDGRILKIEAVSEDSTDKLEDGFVVRRKAQYSQIITLPGEVDADQLKIDRKEGMLVISVPKGKKT